MVKGLRRLLEGDVEPTPEELHASREAIKAQCRSIEAQKRYFLLLQTPYARKRYEELDEELHVLRRILAEYDILTGGAEEK